jgi:hypothetical protein
MNSTRLTLLASLGAALLGICPGADAGRWSGEFGFRAAYDDNLYGTSAVAAVVQGSPSATVFTAHGMMRWQAPAGLFTYALETHRHEGQAEENFTTHRLAGLHSTRRGEWRAQADWQALWIDGSRDTLAGTSHATSHGTGLWRERRAQLQHRGQVQLSGAWGDWQVRAGGDWRDTRYHTRVVPGRIAFADRGELSTSLQLGRGFGADLHALMGPQLGWQSQGTSPLPGGEFHYSNRYWRYLVGLEQKLTDGTTWSVRVGPAHHTITGRVDPRLDVKRSLDTWWGEARLVYPLHAEWKVEARASHGLGMPSTGRSLAKESSGELGLAWTPTTSWSWRTQVRALRSAYYPLTPDDRLVTATSQWIWHLSPQLHLSAALTWQWATNGNGAQHGREFSRRLGLINVVRRF